MAHIQYMEELIREYLVFRGFASTLKAFDQELKSDKEKSFRVDKIIEQIMQLISSHELNGLRELWGHFENHLFNKLESHFTPSVKKLENAILKLYVIHAVTNNKPDKVIDFFLKMTPELQGQSEWKDWFVLPYIKNPEENPTFALHCTKQWQDSLMVSLHNFLASVFQYMPLPTLLHYEEDANRIAKLEQKNESLKNRLALLIDRGPPEANVSPCPVDPPPHLLDDFYIIAQESNVADSQSKSLKNLIRNIGGGVSPVMGRREGAAAVKKRTVTGNR
ncbi:WD repeat-containing protein 91 [Anthonomus grandis grandis]|uniref:WD repeat-containing protein 91 n=1 Tax=Anthonomus grandis grandis TaxID=2921223 RepID=UPI0021652943|nr:WD repeat-containing protein 91 [Anthonomus grandis grandis]